MTQPDGLFVILDSPLVLPLYPVDTSPVKISISILGVEADSLIIVLKGPLALAQGRVDIASVGVGRRILRIEPDSFIILSYGFFPQAALPRKVRPGAPLGLKIHTSLIMLMGRYKISGRDGRRCRYRSWCGRGCG